MLAGIVIGIIVGKNFSIPLAIPIFLIILSFAILFIIRKKDLGYMVIIPLMIIIVSGSYVNSMRFYQSDRSNEIDRFTGVEDKIRIFGEVESWPVLKKQKTYVSVEVDSIVRDGNVYDASGLVLIDIRRATTALARGDYISFSGHLQSVTSEDIFSDFDYNAYLRNKGISGKVSISDPAQILIEKNSGLGFSGIVGFVRKWINECFTNTMSDLSAAMASGFLIGETHDIPDEVYLAFRKTGTLHLLAVSGSNVALVLLVFILILRIFKPHRHVRLIILSLFILLFCHLSYNQPSVVRASVMAVMVLLAQAIYRRAELNNILASAACVLLMYYPGNLFDIGFQLSFGVTWGLVLFTLPVNELLKTNKYSRITRYVLLVVSCSLIASIVSIPILAYYFGEFSSVTVISNLIIVPAVSLAVVGIVILLLCYFIYPPLAEIPGMVLDFLLQWTNSAVMWFGHWDFAVIQVPGVSFISVTIALIGVCLAAAAVGKLFFRRLTVLYILVLSIIFLIPDLSATSLPPASIKILNAGNNHAVIINASGGLVLSHCVSGRNSDGFARRVFSYLNKNEETHPEYYCFLDKEYFIYQQIEQVEERFNSTRLRPVVDSEDFIMSKIWKVSSPVRRAFLQTDLVPVLKLIPGGAKVDIGGYSILYVSDIYVIKELLDGKSLKTDLIIISIGTISDFRKVFGVKTDGRLILLPGKDNNLNKYMADSGFDTIDRGGAGPLEVIYPGEIHEVFPGGID